MLFYFGHRCTGIIRINNDYHDAANPQPNPLRKGGWKRNTKTMREIPKADETNNAEFLCKELKPVIEVDGITHLDDGTGE